VKYNVLFGFFKLGLVLGLFNLARPQPRSQGSGLGLKRLASFNVSVSSTVTKQTERQFLQRLRDNIFVLPPATSRLHHPTASSRMVVGLS